MSAGVQVHGRETAGGGAVAPGSQVAKQGTRPMLRCSANLARRLAEWRDKG